MFQRLISIIVFSGVIFCNITYADEALKFQNISVEEGLSHSYVNSILQDSKGYLWINTFMGTNRYDGYNFVHYTHNPEDSSSISSSTIYTAFEDRDSNLWFGTEKGLNRYVPDKNRFISYENITGDTNSISSNKVHSIIQDAQGRLWVGTYGNMETIAGLAPVLRTFRPPAIGMLVLDYRGYGESAGRPTERGIYRDADAAWASLAARPEIDSARIGVYGRSIGSAVALYFATAHPVKAVVLESPFTSGRAMAKQHYALLPSSLVRLSLDNLARARALSAPLLVIHGSADWIAPITMGRQVAEAGRAEEFMVIEGAGHNETYERGGDRYRERVWRFLQEHLK